MCSYQSIMYSETELWLLGMVLALICQNVSHMLDIIICLNSLFQCFDK